MSYAKKPKEISREFQYIDSIGFFIEVPDSWDGENIIMEYEGNFWGKDEPIVAFYKSHINKTIILPRYSAMPRGPYRLMISDIQSTSDTNLE